MKTVREWLADWVSMHSEHNLKALGVTELLDAEVGSAAEAVSLLNGRIDLMVTWLNGARPRLPGFDPTSAMCRGAGPSACRKGNSCMKHNACVYAGSNPSRPA